MADDTDGEPGAASPGAEEPAWSVDAAHARAKSDEPLTEADKAYFWWVRLADQLTHRAARAQELLNMKGKVAKPYIWLLQESYGDLITYPPVEDYKAAAQYYIDRLTKVQLEKPRHPLRSAAFYLVRYAELFELTHGFAGVHGDAPQPMRPIENSRCMCLCEQLGSLGEAFWPEHGGLNSKGQSQGGQESGSKKREEANKKWRDAAREFLQNLFSQDNALTVYDAKQQLYKWADNVGITLPGDARGIERFVSSVLSSLKAGLG